MPHGNPHVGGHRDGSRKANGWRRRGGRVEGCKKRALPVAAMGCPLLLSLFACPSPSSLTPSIIVHAAPWDESGSCRRTKRVEGEVPEPKRGLHQGTREEEGEEEGGGV